jgi:hypothetical protein
VTFATLYPPISAATIVSVLLFALAWKATQIEKRQGEAPWYLSAGLVAYVGAIGLFLYFSLSRPLAGYFDVFATALAAEGMAVVIVYGLLNAFVFLCGRPLQERAFPVAAAVFLLALMFAGAFAS